MSDSATQAVPEPPQKGRFTFVFTDIEGSTKITRRLEESVGPGAYERLRDAHRNKLLKFARDNGGWEAGRAGDGHFFVFPEAVGALKTVVEFQRLGPISQQIGNAVESVKVRIGVHTCQAVRSAEKTSINGREELYEYPGNDTNFAARVGSLGVGEQIIVSESFVREVWGHEFLDRFRSRETHEDRPAPHSAVPAAPAPDNTPLGLRCWPARWIKSYDTRPVPVFEILYDAKSKQDIREPGSRFFPAFYIGEANRYVERPDKQNAVFAALGLDNRAKKDTGGVAVLKASGGMGKTRLAVTCGVRAAGSFDAGVYFVSLAMAQTVAEQKGGDETFLAGALLNALPEERRKDWGLLRAANEAPPSLGEIIAVLKPRDVLLILDNFESLIPAVGRAFLQAFAVAKAHLLVTTRVEPKVAGLGNLVELDDGMAPAEARDLVLTRIRQRKSGWNPLPADENALADLTKFVHGSPLSLELAAAHVPNLPLPHVVAGIKATPLGDGLASYANWDDAEAFQRHQSLIRTLDWSYGVLPVSVHPVFAATGLFPDDFPLDALTTAAGCGPLLVGTLVASSLLQTTGDGRYSQHNVTRAYARMRLLGGEVVTHLDEEAENGMVTETRPGREDAHEIRGRFIGWYADFLLQRRLPGAWDLDIDNPDVRAALSQERTGILAAAREACSKQSVERALEFRRYGRFLQRAGFWEDAQNLTTDLQSLPQSEKNRSWLLHERANVLDSQGRWEEAIAAYQAGLAIDRELGDQRSEAASLHGLANVLDRQGRWDEAIETYRQSLDIKRQIGDRQGEAATLASIGGVYFSQGNFTAACDQLQDAIERLHALGDAVSEALVRSNRAVALANAGRLPEAVTEARASVAVFERTQDANGLQETRQFLAQLEALNGG